MTTTRYESLFTASQWQELEHQALIFKYMVSGIPIPSDLLFPIKSSLMDSSISSTLFPHHQPIGWSCFQMGFGRKPDPEPGRCRRTDGKKWRCSKEAYPDSKYCEKHMHRGRNRSRKPVELTPTPPPLPSNTTTSSNSSFHPSFYSHSSSSSSMKPLGFDFSFQNSNTDLALDSGGCHSLAHKDFRNKCFYGLKEEMGEHSSFDDSWRLKMSSSSSSSSSVSHSKQSNFFLSDQFRDQRNQQKERHCFVLGADFKSERAVVKGRGDEEEQTEQPLRHFLDDKWSNKSRELNEDSFSTTQLSISIPMSNSRSPDW